MRNLKDKITGKLYIVFLIIAVFWTAMIANKGIDMSDMGYSLTNYKYALENASSLSIGMFLSNYVGGIIYSLLPAYHLLVFKLLNVLIVGTCYYITFYILKDYMQKNLRSYHHIC